MFVVVRDDVCIHMLCIGDVRICTPCTAVPVYVLLQLPGLRFEMPDAARGAMQAAAELQAAWTSMSPEQFTQHVAALQHTLAQHLMDMGNREAAVRAAESNTADILRRVQQLEQQNVTLAEVKFQFS